MQVYMGQNFVMDLKEVDIPRVPDRLFEMAELLRALQAEGKDQADD